ncbi:MAG: sigma-70 family RNA polymerase sigma factor [Clostridia bacterium]|nr:sigma-70 family RNA polymerase sigma factor [Clostridia bacterium]
MKNVLVLTDKKAVCEKYFDSIYRLVLCRAKNKDATDDIVQEVFYKYIKCEKEFETEEHVKAWLIRVAINASNSYFTSSWFKKTEALDENMVFDTKEKSDVYYAVMELPQKYRTVIHLFYYEDLPVAKIAAYLGLNESTVKSQLKRGREMLAAKLKGEYDYV